MIAAWFVEGDLAEFSGQDKEKVRKFSGAIVTKGADVLPNVPDSLEKNQRLILVREVKLLVEFNKPQVDFAVNQSTVSS